jgi:hypothetical protein
MYLLLILGCVGTGADKPSDTGAADTADTADTVPGGPGFYASGTVDDAPLAVACGPATASSLWLDMGDGQLRLDAGCDDTSTPEVRSVSVAIFGGHIGTTSDCGTAPGQAVVQVSDGEAYASCFVDGAHTFEVVLDLIDDTAAPDVHFTGSFSWQNQGTDLSGTFDVIGAQGSGC